MLDSSSVLQNRYRVIRELGRGGMGAVYHAWDMRLSIPVALKEMIPQSDLDDEILQELRRQFQQEATVLARLNHPHLVGVTDFFEEGRNIYLVMQFVEGQSLSERIKQYGALPEEQVIAWSGQLLEALSYCHSQGVIHRDIKPQNIIIRPDGGAVLVDFGLVKLWDPNDPKTRTAVRGIGTPQYAPPEQYELESGHTEPRSDLYSLGATMYHALTGQAPPTATLRISAPEEFAPVRAVVGHVSNRTASTIERAMELPRSQRWSTAAEMAQGFGLHIRDWGLPGAAPTGSERPGRGGTVKMGMGATERMPRRGRRPGRRRFPIWAWILIGVLALVVLGGGALVATGAIDVGIQAFAADTATPTPEPTPTVSPTLLPTNTIAPTSTATSTPTRTPVPKPTSTPTRTPRPTRTPTQTPTVTPTPSPTATSGPTNTPKPTVPPTTPPPTTVPAASPTDTPVPPPDGDIGRIIFTLKAGDAYYLYSTDPAWSTMQEIGLTDYSHSTCAGGGTASTLTGTTVNLYGVSQCGLSERTDVCTSPDGAYKVITNFIEGWQYSLTVQDVASGAEKWYYQGKLNTAVGIQWAWNSRRFIFGVDGVINVIQIGTDGYWQALGFYTDTWIPRFSPDGSMLYYLKPTGNEGASDVFIVNIDGTGERNLTNAPIAHKYCPRWQR